MPESKDESAPVFQRIHNAISPELSDEVLECYLLSRIRDQKELSKIEAHLRNCPACAERTQAMADSISTLKNALQQLEMGTPENSERQSTIHCINRS